MSQTLRIRVFAGILLLFGTFSAPSTVKAQNTNNSGYAFCRLSPRYDKYLVSTIFAVSLRQGVALSAIKTLLENDASRTMRVGGGVANCETFADLAVAKSEHQKYTLDNGWNLSGKWLPHTDEYMTEIKNVEDASVARRQAYKMPFKFPAPGEFGYEGATVGVEYQLMVCMGELHIAYSLLDGSVTAPPRSYKVGRRTWEAPPPSATISSLSVTGTVFDPDLKETIGKFADNFAAEALGFSCFSGQTKKIAGREQLKKMLQFYQTPERKQAYFDRLRASFNTTEVLKSGDAEREIAAKHPEAFRTDEANQEVGRQREAQDRAQRVEERRKQEEARRQEQDIQAARAKALNEEVIARNAEVQRRNKAAADAFSAQQTAHAAAIKDYEERLRLQQQEVARAAEARAAYERQLQEYQRQLRGRPAGS